MAVLIAKPSLERRIKRQFVHPDMTRHHECWEGVTYVPPEPNNELQVLLFGLGIPFYETIVRPEIGLVCPGCNISNRVKGWAKNYRIPDLAVFLNTTTAVNHQTHWVGGPDFMIEILSDGEGPYDKFEFYSSVRTREILLIDRDPWTLELHRLIDGQLARVGRFKLGDATALTSTVVPLAFSLDSMTGGRPRVTVSHTESDQVWSC